jgi:hypothetical protein
MNSIAQWLNETFASFDASAAAFANSLHHSGAGPFLDILMEFLSFFGSSVLIIPALFLLLFRSSRKQGLTILLAMLIGALLTNLLLKNLIARPRPYADAGSDFFTFWSELGYGELQDTSFPSGHTTAAFAAMTSLFLWNKKSFRWLFFIPAAAVGFSRIYFCVHYASDVLFGALIGTGAAVIAFYLIRSLLKRTDGTAFSNFSVLQLFKK